MHKINKFVSAKVGFFLLTITVMSTGILANTTLAQTSSLDERGQGIEISPPVIDLAVEPGETLTTEISIRNITDVELIAQGAVNDFLAGNETGAPRILFEEEEDSPYSLKDYIAEVPNLTLRPRELKKVEITINVPDNASPGGHYGLVRFIAIPSGSDAGGSAVDLSASIGTLVLLNVSGDVREAAEVEQFTTVLIEPSDSETISTAPESRQPTTGTFFEYGPVGFLTRLKNTGNVHLRPLGSIKITNILGREVDTLDFNPTDSNVLPASIRRFDHTLDKKWLFGRYSANLNVVYGSDDASLSTVTNFWVIPWKIVTGVLLLLLAVGYFGRKALQAYKRSIIDKSRQEGSGERSL